MAVMPLATVVMAHFFTTGDRMTPSKFAGVVIGAFGIGGFWLFFQYRELLNIMKNFKIKEIEFVEKL